MNAVLEFNPSIEHQSSFAPEACTTFAHFGSSALIKRANSSAVLPTGSGFAGWMGVAAGVLVAAAGLAGDLAKSAWKREAGVKDSGRVFPGHGGVLDRMDSTFYALPIVYVFAVVAAALLGWPAGAG